MANNQDHILQAFPQIQSDDFEDMEDFQFTEQNHMLAEFSDLDDNSSSDIDASDKTNSPKIQQKELASDLTGINFDDSMQEMLGLYKNELMNPQKSQEIFQLLSDSSRFPVAVLKQQFNKKYKQNLNQIQPKKHQIKLDRISAFIEQIVTAKPKANINQLRNGLEKIGIQLNKDQILKKLKGLNYRKERLNIRKIIKEKGDKQIRQQFAYRVEKAKSRGEQILFFGQRGFSLDELLGQFWMKYDENGTSLFVSEPSNVVTVTMITSQTRIQFYAINEGYYCQQMHLQAMDMWLRMLETQFQQKREDKPKHLALQDCSIHPKSERQKQLKQRMDALGMNSMYIPPESPLNPLDILFNILKYNLRRTDIRSMPELKLCIEKAINNLNSQDLAHSFADLQICLRRAEECRDFQ